MTTLTLSDRAKGLIAAVVLTTRQLHDARRDISVRRFDRIDAADKRFDAAVDHLKQYVAELEGCAGAKERAS